ncbi:hypothetical protein [Streptomyces specialis]|uniref:hypothetical protein n=1 Tax=Streptomyces specialis TaxID=498367 RepID=UPI00073F6621|nr:hypothetical protein [Streptomyces specialis]
MTEHEPGPGTRPEPAPESVPEPVADAGPAPSPLDDEEALRQLLRDIVDDLEPSAASLEHLRAAVPARMRRRRQVLAGATASVAVVAVGLVLVVSAVADVTGGDDGTTLDAGEGHAATGDLGQSDTGGELGGYPSGGLASGDDAEAGGDSGGGEPTGEEAGAAESTPDAWETMGVTSPSCDRGQLGSVQTSMSPPDAEGRVYGLIRVSNVSDQPCRVEGNGDMAALPLGAVASAAEVQIVDRTEGDGAPLLPPPDETLEQLVLPPGEAYEVRFAFVPDTGVGSCEVEALPAAGSGEEPPPLAADDPDTAVSPNLRRAADGGATLSDDSGSGGDTPAGSGEGGATEGGTGGVGSEPTEGPTEEPPGDTGGTTGPDEVVLLRYTPAAGEPEAAEIRLEGDCSGTIYRTGVLEAPTA